LKKTDASFKQPNLNKMNQVPVDIIMEICSHLDAVSITYLSSTCKTFKIHFQSEQAKKIISDRAFPYQGFISKRLWNSGARYAAECNNITQVDYFVSKGAMIACAIRGAIDKGNVGIVESYIHMAVDLTFADIESATFKGNLRIFKLLVTCFANNDLQWRHFMEIAARMGHIDIVKFCADKGPFSWNVMMEYAAEGGHMDIVKLFISKGANDWFSGLGAATKGGNIDMVKFFVEKQPVENPDLFMSIAATACNLELVKYFAQMGAKNFGICVCLAAKHDHSEMIKYLINAGATNFEGAITIAMAYGHEKTVKILESARFGKHSRYTPY
jgi:ankyrin repeat protein